jgi:thioredoxin 1
MNTPTRIATTAFVLLAASAIIFVKHRSKAPGSTQPAARLPRVVDLGADKCKECKALAPILEELRKEYAGRAQVDFIDTWKDPSAGQTYGIRIIPTQIFFDKEGKEISRNEGFLSKADFVKRLQEAGMK